MTTSDLQDRQLHVQARCPACDAEVHIVGNTADGTARWCCLACKTLGVTFLRVSDRDGNEITRHPIRAAA